MDKKKLGFFAIVIAMVLIIVGILVATLQSKNEEKVDEKETSKQEEKITEFEEEVEKHTEYVQDYERDPFNNIDDTLGAIEINGLDFNFEYINGATYENTAATLIDSTENYLLFNNYNNVLTYYDKKTKEKFVIDEHISDATITTDENFIVYSKNVFDSEAFYYLDLETLQTKEFNIYYHGSRMKVLDMKVKDGLVYFIVQDDATNKTSVHFTVLPAYMTKHTERERNSVVNIDTEKLYVANNQVLAYNKATHSLDKIMPLNEPEPMIIVDSETIQKLRSIDYYDKDKWAIAITNDKNEHLIITPNGKINEFEGLMGAYWFDKEHLVVVDNLSLYLHNLKTGKTDVMKAGISYVFPTLDSLNIQTNDGDILALKKKKQ